MKKKNDEMKKVLYCILSGMFAFVIVKLLILFPIYLTAMNTFTTEQLIKVSAISSFSLIILVIMLKLLESTVGLLKEVFE